MKKLIKDINYIELDNFLNQDIKLNESQFIQLKNHKNIDDLHFWGRTKNGKILEYSLEILKDNGNIYSSVDICVKVD